MRSSVLERDFGSLLASITAIRPAIKRVAVGH